MKPRKRQGATPAPAPASTPAPAPAPAPAAAKPAPKPAEPKRREEEREEEPKPKRKTGEKREEKPKTPPAPVAGAVTTSTPPYAPDAGTVETPDTEMIGRSGPLSFLGVGRPIYAFTEPSAAETAELESLKPYLTALDRVEELRRQGKIGEQVREEKRERGSMEEGTYRPASRPFVVLGKSERARFARQPVLREAEMPTAGELTIRRQGARKMKEIMQEREDLRRQRLSNVRAIKELESMLRRAEMGEALGLQTQTAEIDAALKKLAAEQRELSERVATKNMTLREYGMTNEEIEPK